jgi:hypothetical protein
MGTRSGGQQLLTLRQAADRLGVKIPTLYELIRDGNKWLEVQYQKRNEKGRSVMMFELEDVESLRLERLRHPPAKWRRRSADVQLSRVENQEPQQFRK